MLCLFAAPSLARADDCTLNTGMIAAPFVAKLPVGVTSLAKKKADRTFTQTIRLADGTMVDASIGGTAATKPIAKMLLDAADVSRSLPCGDATCTVDVQTGVATLSYDFPL